MIGQKLVAILFYSLAGVLLCVNMVFSNTPSIFPFKYQEKILDNQLKIILIPIPGSGLVSYYSIVRTGSRDEYEPGHTGFAHFFEHMMFRGTKNYPGEVYDRMMTEMGADANAYTTDDYTCYHINLANEDLETVIKLESDRFQNLSYSEQAFRTEAGAVRGEYLKGLASPWSRLQEKLLATAFKKHTYRHTVIGFRKDIEAMPGMYQYSLKFFHRYYRPDNVVLLVAGDFDPEFVIQKIEHYYGAWQPGYVPPKIPREPEQKRERHVKIRFKGRTQPIVAIAYKGLAFDPTNLDVAATLLFSDLAFGETSEIYKKLVIDEQRVQFIEGYMGLNRDPKLNTIYTMVKDKNDIQNIIAEIDKTIQKFQTEKVTVEKLEKQQSHNKYSFLMGLDTPEKVAGGLARFVALTGGIEAVDKLYASFSRVTPEDIQSVAKKYFVKSRRTVAILEGGQ